MRKLLRLSPLIKLKMNLMIAAIFLLFLCSLVGALGQQSTITCKVGENFISGAGTSKCTCPDGMTSEGEHHGLRIANW